MPDDMSQEENKHSSFEQAHLCSGGISEYNRLRCGMYGASVECPNARRVR
jgi:hypothetical protein